MTKLDFKDKKIGKYIVPASIVLVVLLFVWIANGGLGFIGKGTDYSGACLWQVSYGLTPSELTQLGCTGDHITVRFRVELVSPNNLRKTVYSQTGSGSIPGTILYCSKQYNWGYEVYALADRWYLPENVSGNWKVEFYVENAFDTTKKLQQSYSFYVPASCLPTNAPVCVSGYQETTVCADGSSLVKRACVNGQYIAYNVVCPPYSPPPQPSHAFVTPSPTPSTPTMCTQIGQTNCITYDSPAVACSSCPSGQVCDLESNGCIAKKPAPPLAETTPSLNPSPSPTPSSPPQSDNTPLIVGVIVFLALGGYLIYRHGK